MKYVKITTICASLFLFSCGGDDGGSSVSALEVSAPESVAGTRFLLEIASGTGILASAGQATAIFNDDSTYNIIGDSQYTINSQGTYTYTAEETTGKVVFEDTVLSINGQIEMIYTSESTGTYKIDATRWASQSGKFSEL